MESLWGISQARGVQCTMTWQHRSLVKGRCERERTDRNRQVDNENAYSWGIK